MPRHPPDTAVVFVTMHFSSMATEKKTIFTSTTVSKPISRYSTTGSR